MTNAENYQFNCLKARFEGKTLILSFNRPEVLNAINSDMEIGLYEALQRAENDDNVQVVLLKAEGRAFSAGHDLAQVAKEIIEQPEQPPTIGGKYWMRTGEVLPSWEFTKPIVAAVHGYVGPHANAILMTCDFVIAAENTRFSFEATKDSNTGVPFGPYCLMPFYFPMRVIKKIWMAGGWFDENQALDLHYVQRIVPLDELEDEALRHCKYLETLPTQAMQASKKGLHQMYDLWGLMQMVVLGRDPYQMGEEDQQAFMENMKLIYEHGTSVSAKKRDSGDDEDITKL